ncbi:unnamed protein product [Meganyctiphanes norvegica]|uniref:Nucleoporin Nup37 n=1 Tax=Meganyctiphanes norvegica TaxID=48144 RepID=A0AAV2PUV9_MEGNR
MEVSVDPAFSVDTRACVHTVEFSPFEWSRGLLAVGLPNSIVVYSIKLKEESDDSNEECEQVWEWHVSSQPVTVAWSPAATLRSAPRCLQELMSHSDCVNSVAYNGENGNLAASTGDDLTLRVWDRSTLAPLIKFLLTSPGMTVTFHPEDGDLLMVGEKSGVVRVYSVGSGCATLSLRSSGPLLSADWSIPNPSLLVAAGAKGITVWNVSSPQPRSENVEIGGGEKVLNLSVCRSTPGLVATLSPPHTIRVSHIHTNKVPVAVHLKVVGGMSWHQHLPYLAVGSDRRVLFWKVDNI